MSEKNSILRNQLLPGLFPGKSISYDFYPCEQPRAIVIFIPGFKGFKDWGTWNLMAGLFPAAGFHFLKANLSHNGIDLSRDENELTDLVAFSNNNFSIELDDLYRLVTQSKDMAGVPVALIGHSRGGALSILAASHDPRINAVISWASPVDFGNHFFSEHIPQWEKEGVYYIRNNRTGQDLPLRYQLYQDYVLNRDRLHIPSRAKKITQPWLAIHGDQDETVPFTALEKLKKNCPNLKTHTIKGGDHTFGARHPWDKNHLPTHLDEAVRASIDFLNEIFT